MLEQVPRYQKDVNVINHKVTDEYKSIDKILSLIPKLKVLDIAGAEGYLAWLAAQHGHSVMNIEIDEGRVLRGRKHFPEIEMRADNIFDNLDILSNYNVYMVSRFFHNIGYDKSVELMDAIEKQTDYILIIKYKPGLVKETGKPREKLATKKGINDLLEQYGIKKKSFPQQVIVAARGKYEYIPDMLRQYIREG